MIMHKTIIISFACLLIGAAAALLFVKAKVAAIPEPAFHEHADFALFLDGVRFDFARPEFMSNKPCVITDASWFVPAALAHGNDLEDAVHLHDGDGSVIHVHRENVTMHDFFESLNMVFEDGSFTDNEGGVYKDNDLRSFRYFVNGEEVESIQDYVIRNQDQILITYGLQNRDQAGILAEIGQISNRACLFSGTCSHRGLAPIESCGASETKPSRVLEWLGI